MINNLMGKNIISVIVPTFNSIKKIDKLLRSIENQTYKKFELIFVDDGSDDGTYEYLKRYALDRNNTKVIRQNHAGPGIARKRGFEESSGDLVFFIDSDDWLPEAETLYRMNQIFVENKNIDIAIANRIRYPSGEIVPPFDYKQSKIKPGIYGLDVFRDNFVVGNMSAKIFRRKKLFSGMFIGAFTCEDICTSYMYFDKCKTILYADEIFYVANRSESNNSLTRSDNYKLGLITERAYNIVETFNKLNSIQLKASLASIALDVYCSIIRNRIVDDKNTIRALEEVISSVDLSGFYSEYSVKKKLVLKYLKFKVRMDRK